MIFYAVSYQHEGEKVKPAGSSLTSMLSKFGVAQDLFAELQSVSVLLVLVTSLQQRQI